MLWELLRGFMKKASLFCRMIGLILVLSLFWVPVFASQPMETDTATAEQTGISGSFSVDAQQPLFGNMQLIENVKAAILYEASTKTLMYAWNPDTQLPPSSLVKIMTALIAVEQGELTDAVTVKQNVLDTVPYDAVSAELQADEIMTLGDLLYCMMTGSANDAAAVIADHIAGSQGAFVQLMNERARELGCANTNFVNVHGLHAESQLTTVRDVVKVLEAAVANEAFFAVFSAVNYSVPATNKSETRKLSTGNFLMNREEMEIYYDSRVTGGRTGTAGDGTKYLAATAKVDSMELISVVMGAESKMQEDGNKVSIFGGFNETRTLLDAGFDGYKAVQVIFNGQALVQWQVENGESMVTAGPKTAVSTVLPSEVALTDLDFRYSAGRESLRAPIEIGDRICSVEVWCGSVCVAQTDLYAMNSVRESGHLSKEQKEQGTGSAVHIVLLVLCGLMVIGVVFLSTVRMLGRARVAAKKRRSRQHRVDRRRSR